MAFFVAFYSYKGGVGRTLALSNVAWALADLGKRVVLIDMDLEAPSLHETREFRPKAGRSRGFLEYAAAYRENGECPPIGKFIHECRAAETSGKIFLMPAGQNRHPDYQPTLGGLPWRRLHEQKGSLPFVDSLRHAIEQEFQPDYVLIDARTGLSDIGGLSTNLLSDLVVMFFNLTETCIDGSSQALCSFISPESRPKRVQLVASPVPPHDTLVEKRLKLAQEKMAAALSGSELICIDYDPSMTLADDLSVRKPDKYRVYPRYRQILQCILEANVAEVATVLDRVKKFRAGGRITDAIQTLDSFLERNPSSAEALVERGSLLLENGRALDSIDSLERATRLRPQLAAAWSGLSLALADASRFTEAVDALEQFECLESRNDLATADFLTVLAIRFFRIARCAEGQERRSLLSRACQKFERVLSIAPLRHEALFYSGVSLSELANDATLEDRRIHLETAVNKFATAAESIPGHLETLNNWGRALLELSHCFSGVERQELLVSAREKFERARVVKAEDPLPLENLGNTLIELSRGADPLMRDKFLEEAERQFETSLALKPDRYEALAWLGNLQIEKARHCQGEARQAMLEAAKAKYELALKIEPRKLYNLACSLALLGRVDEAAVRLQEGLQSQPRLRESALEDEDLSNIWQKFPEMRIAIEQSLQGSLR